MIDEKDLSAAEISIMKKISRTQLQKSSHEVEVLRSNSPLYSIKSFKQLQLPEAVLKGVYAMGYNAPSKIQEITLPILLADPPVNLIAQSQNGTGKTAAFVLSSVARIDVNLRYPQVLILAPTYELAFQIYKVAKNMAQFCEGIKFRLAVRGEQLPRGTTITEHIVIGTPGKVFNWTRRNNFFDVKKIKIMIFDEADVMISTQGHQDECLRIHKLASPISCQMMLFSATFNSEVMNLAEMIIKDPIIILLKREEETLDNVKQYYVICNSNEDKYASLNNIYGTISIGQAIIFCRTRQTAAWLGKKMTSDGHSVGYLTGDLELNQRLEVLSRFREGKEKVLITTNVCSRGIDVEQVTIVINFDLPVTVSGEADCETYLHRIGRSGRFGKRGIAISMITKDERILKDIEKHFGKCITRIDTNDVDDLEKIYC